MSNFETEDGRIAAAESAGRNVALFELREGHTEPRSWEKDGQPFAGAYSHLAAVGFTRFGSRAYSSPFVRAYLQAFADRATQRGDNPSGPIAAAAEDAKEAPAWEYMKHQQDGKTCWCGDAHDGRFPSI